MALTFHLIRHGHTAALGNCLAGRGGHWPLTEEGALACEAVAATMAGIGLDAVVSSPMLRAQQTANPLAASAGVAVRAEAGFDEIDFGDWTGRSFADLHGDPAWTAWNSFRAFARVPGGETMAEAQARALAALGGLLQVWPDGTVAVVSHADIIKAILAGLLGAPLELMRRLTIDPASRSVVRLHRTDAEVLAVNLPPGG